MFLFRIVLLGLGMLGTYVASLSFQEGSGVDIGIGIAGIVVALLCFFVLAKALWRILGCMTTFIVVAVIVAGIGYFLYSSGLLDKVKNMTAKKPQAVATQTQGQQLPATAQTPSGTVQTATADGKDEIQAFLDQLPAMLDEAEKNPQAHAQEAVPEGPRQSPIVVGKVDKVASGELFRINNIWIRLFGLAAPHPNQTCLNKSHRTYNCGRMVTQKLKEIVGEDELTCTIMGTDIQGAALATCTIMKDYDLGVVLVENGWAVALRNISPVYIPYEDEAHAKKEGLWAGQFMAPWEWLDQQQMQEQRAKEAAANYKPPKPVVKKKKKKSMFDSLL